MFPYPYFDILYRTHSTQCNLTIHRTVRYRTLPYRTVPYFKTTRFIGPYGTACSTVQRAVPYFPRFLLIRKYEHSNYTPSICRTPTPRACSTVRYHTVRYNTVHVRYRYTSWRLGPTSNQCATRACSTVGYRTIL